MWYDRYYGLMPLTCGNISKKKLSQMQNDIEFVNMFENYFTLAQNIFQWDNLPETCDERFLERSLLLYGRAMIADLDGSLVTLGSANGAGVNLYGYSIKAYGWGLNGFNREFPVYVPGADSTTATRQSSDGTLGSLEPKAVICFDNVDAYPFVTYIFNTAKRVADLLRSCDVAVQNLKSPYIVTCDETDVNSVKEALSQRDNNVAAIITARSTALDSMRVWQTYASDGTLKAFWEQLRNIEGQLFETLGINSNANQDKRERLLVDEINSNNEFIRSNLDKRLRQREIFCDRVNELFGTSISVHLRSDEYVDQLSETEDFVGDSRDDNAARVVQGDDD